MLLGNDEIFSHPRKMKQKHVLSTVQLQQDSFGVREFPILRNFIYDMWKFPLEIWHSRRPSLIKLGNFELIVLDQTKIVFFLKLEQRVRVWIKRKEGAFI